MSNTVPVSLSQTQIATLEKFYTMRQRSEILRFLEGSPAIVSTLLEAPPRFSITSLLKSFFLTLELTQKLLIIKKYVIAQLGTIDKIP